MQLKKNIELGKIKIKLYLSILFFSIFIFLELNASDSLEGNYTDLKILDKGI